MVIPARFRPSLSIGQAQQSAVSMPLQAPTGRRTVFQYQVKALLHSPSLSFSLSATDSWRDDHVNKRGARVSHFDFHHHHQSDSRSGLPALEKPTSSSPLLCHRPSQSQPLQEEKQSHHGPQRLFELNRRHASGFGGGWYGEN